MVKENIHSWKLYFTEVACPGDYDTFLLTQHSSAKLSCSAWTGSTAWYGTPQVALPPQTWALTRTAPRWRHWSIVRRSSRRRAGRNGWERVRLEGRTPDVASTWSCASSGETRSENRKKCQFNYWCTVLQVHVSHNHRSVHSNCS